MNRAIRVSLVFTLFLALLLPLSAYAGDYQNFPSYMDNGVKARYNPNLKAVDTRENPLRRLMNNNSGQLGMGHPAYSNSYSSDVQGRAISLSNVPPSKSAMAYNQYRALPAQRYVRPVAVVARSNPLASAVNSTTTAPGNNSGQSSGQNSAPNVQTASTSVPRTQAVVSIQPTQTQSAPPREATVISSSPPPPRNNPPAAPPANISKSNQVLNAD